MHHAANNVDGRGGPGHDVSFKFATSDASGVLLLKTLVLEDVEAGIDQLALQEK